MQKEQKELNFYFKIIEGKRKPKFFNLKALVIRKAKTNLDQCRLCEWQCRVNRQNQLGKCKVNAKMKVSSWFMHLGEEPFFIPSFTIFFYSCNFACVYCQNYPISQRLERPQQIRPIELANVINKGAIGCKNINLVGGEPTPYLPFILECLNKVKLNKPVIWNSNFYFSKEAFLFIKSITDVYLPDFKYGSNKCAERLSKVKNYWEILTRNLLTASKDKEANLVIRHLVLPNHFKCCTKPIIDWISSNLNKYILNLMDQYRPYYKASQYEVNRSLTKQEFKEVLKYAEQKGINYIF